MQADLKVIIPDGKGREDLFILSISTSQISLIILPEAKVQDAANAASKIFKEKQKFGLQIIAATTTDMKVIRKLIGRISITNALNFSIKSL